MLSANEQIKSILEIIQHKIDISMPRTEYLLPVSELEHLPDHLAIMDKLDWELSAISLYAYPNAKKLDPASIDLYEMEHSKQEFNDYMSYAFSIDKKFKDVYEEYIELNPKGVRIIRGGHKPHPF